MIKKLLFFACVLSCLFTSCKKDSESGSKDKGFIIEASAETAMRVTLYISRQTSGQNYQAVYYIDNKDVGTTYSYSKDGLQAGDEISVDITTTKGKMINVKAEYNGIGIGGTYSANGGTNSALYTMNRYIVR